MVILVQEKEEEKDGPHAARRAGRPEVDEQAEAFAAACSVVGLLAARCGRRRAAVPQAKLMRAAVQLTPAKEQVFACRAGEGKGGRGSGFCRTVFSALPGSFFLK